MPDERLSTDVAERERLVSALKDDFDEICESLDGSHIPVETRRAISEPYLKLIKAGCQLAGDSIKWVPPNEDPSAEEMAASLRNLKTLMLTSDRVSAAQSDDIIRFCRAMRDLLHKVHQANEFDFAFQELDTKKKYGRWVQSIGIRDDVDPDELDGDDGTEIYAGPRARIELESEPRQARNSDNYEIPLFLGTGVRKGRDCTLPKNTLYRHTATLGVTGYGKSTLITNNQKQLIEAGKGICFIDPKGDDSERLMEIVPEDRKDDIIWIEPGSTTGKISGFNFINVGLPPDHPQIETAVSALVEDLKKMLGAGQYWGPRMDRIAGNIIRAMNIYNREFPNRLDLNLADLYYVLADARSRREFSVLVQAAGVDFIEDYTAKIADMEDEKLEPILGRMQPWIESPIARRMICFREAEINIPSAVEEGKIIVVRMGGQPKELKRMLGMAVVRRIWATIRARADVDEHQRDPFYLFVDEAHNIALADETFPTMLAEARSYRLSINLATQYLSQLPENVVRAVRVNCDTIMSFNAGSIEEARQISPQLDMEPTDLLNEGRFNVWMRMTDPDSGELTEPFKVYIHPPFPPHRTSEQAREIINESLDRVGREKITPEERKNRLQFYRGDGQAEIGIGQEIIAAEQDDDLPPEVIESIVDKGIKKQKERLYGAEELTDDGEIEEKDSDQLDETDRRILESIFAARVKGGYPPNAPVPITEAEAEMESRIGEIGYGSDVANAAEALSQFVKLRTKKGTESLQLTADGRAVVFGSTGEGITGGRYAHRRILRQSFELFTRLGYYTSLPTQEGDEQPDGIAETPFNPADVDTAGKSVQQIQDELEQRQQELKDEYPAIARLSNGEGVRIEAETSTHLRPSHTLQNLRKSLNRDAKTAFVTKGAYFDDEVPDSVDDGTAYWGPFIERIIYDTERNGRRKTVPEYGDDNITLAKETTEDGNRVFYNKDGQYEVVIDAEWYPAVKPASDSQGTRWQETSDGEIIAQDPGKVGEEGVDATFAVFDDQEHVGRGDPSTVPGYFYYNKAEGYYAVVTEGEELYYEDKEAMQEEWETFNPAWLPQVELDRYPTEDDFLIIVLPSPDNPIHDQPLLIERGESYPLFDLLEMDPPDHAYFTEEAREMDATTGEMPSESADEQQHAGPATEATTAETETAADDSTATTEPTADESATETETTAATAGDTDTAGATADNGDTAEHDEEFDPFDRARKIEQKQEAAESPATKDTEREHDTETQFAFGEVTAKADVPQNCPVCGGPLSFGDTSPFLGAATDIQNFKSVVAALTRKGVVDIDKQPPQVTEPIQTEPVVCDDCGLSKSLYFDEETSTEPTPSGPSQNAENQAESEAESKAESQAESVKDYLGRN